MRFCALTCSRIGAETILAIGFSNKTTIQLFGDVSIFFRYCIKLGVTTQEAYSAFSRDGKMLTFARIMLVYVRIC